MKRVLWWIGHIALCMLVLSEIGWANDKKEGQNYTQKQSDEYYLEGAVPEVDGKVVFIRELELPGWSQDQIFDKVKEWLALSERQDQDIILSRNVIREDREKGEIYVQNQEYLVFIDRGLSLDRANFSFVQHYVCSPNKCVLEISRLKYVYENVTRVAEGWISDDYALDKTKTKVYPGVRRHRIRTVDRMDELFAGLTGMFMTLQVMQSPAVQSGLVSVPVVVFPDSPTSEAPVPAKTPTVSPVPVSAPAVVEATPSTPVEEPGVATLEAPGPVTADQRTGWIAETPPPPVETTTESTITQEGEKEMPGYRRIAPDQISGNIIKRLNEEWMLVTAGDDAKFNMMTASWGGLGVLFGKPVAFCFISPSRYTWQLLDQGDTYTLTFYAESYRDVLRFCGSHSGSDIDKVQATGLTPITTPSGAKAFDEAWMVIECRKLMQQPLSPTSIVDSIERANWNDKVLHTMFVGEILNVWVK